MCRARKCAGCTLYARCAYHLCKAWPRLLRSMDGGGGAREAAAAALETEQRLRDLGHGQGGIAAVENDQVGGVTDRHAVVRDRKSTRLNSSHPSISYAVFCLKKK